MRRTWPDPFEIEVSDAAVEDLRARLARTRFIEASRSKPWGAGADPAYLSNLRRHWLDGHDWAATQDRLNTYRHYRTTVGGNGLHFVHFPARDGSGRLPVLLCHGWPSSFLELLPLAQRLSDPARFGIHDAPPRDVVVPSLPGFAFSEPMSGPATRLALADCLVELMSEQLGYRRFAAFGGDIGGSTAAWMGAVHPEHVAGLHLIHPPTPSEPPPHATAQEQHFYAATAEFDGRDEGYSSIMVTRPDTVAAALIDSPIGLAAWLADKLRAWSDCGGDIEHRFGADDVIELTSLYWFTGSISSSFRPYLDWPHNGPRPRIDVPVAVTLTHEDPWVPVPRSLVERECSDIRAWSEPLAGGHFLAFEEPDLVCAELRGFLAGIESD